MPILVAAYDVEGLSIFHGMLVFLPSKLEGEFPFGSAFLSRFYTVRYNCLFSIKKCPFGLPQKLIFFSFHYSVYSRNTFTYLPHILRAVTRINFVSQ